MTTTTATPLRCLVGKFFHTTKDCPCGIRTAVWQGHIVSSPAPDILLIELFEWVMGEACGQELITLNDFMAKKPLIYQDNEEMRFSYEHGSMRHHCTNFGDQYEVVEPGNQGAP